MTRRRLRNMLEEKPKRLWCISEQGRPPPPPKKWALIASDPNVMVILFKKMKKKDDHMFLWHGKSFLYYCCKEERLYRANECKLNAVHKFFDKHRSCCRTYTSHLKRFVIIYNRSRFTNNLG